LKIFIFIFHKDRFNYLSNLLASVEKNLKLPKNYYEIIIHDASKKNKVRNKLKKINKKYKIILEGQDQDNIHKSLGGLYNSMNNALKYSINKNANLMMFLQDDMQFTSEVDLKVLSHISDIFEKTSATYINNTFIRLNKYKTFNKFVISECKSFYYNFDNSYNDTGIFNVDVLKRINFTFQYSENENELFFKSKSSNSVNLKNPFVSYLPWPVTSRRSKFDKYFITRLIKNVLVWINGKGIGAGVNKIELKNSSKFLNRDIAILPVAENFLKTKKKLLLPWSYEPYFDIKKITTFKNFIKFDWIFNGGSGYINELENTAKEILEKKEFKIED